MEENLFDLLKDDIKKDNIKYEDITIAILAKDSEHVLPLYLNCIYNLEYPKKKILLYIRSNDNNDNTINLLNDFIIKYKNEYKKIYYDFSSINSELKKYIGHNWNELRFKILGEIRQESINFAIENNSHYFVVDCDNFINPNTLTKLYEQKELNVIGPMLNSSNYYSNYHYITDDNGYLKESDIYYKILNKEIVGCIKVDVVHCSYFINNNVLRMINYNDNSKRHEYVIFSDNLRRLNINQYIDNRFNYGYITFANNKSELIDETDKLINYLSNYKYSV